MQAKQKKNESAPEKISPAASKGPIEEYIPFLPFLAVPFVLIAVAVVIMGRRKKRTATKKVVELKIPAKSKDPEEEIEEDRKKEEERRMKEQQKEALRQLLMQKIADKNAERK